MDPFIGMICAFGFNYAPTGWFSCYGSTMSIAQNTALFALIGTTYGGNGQSTFALPDLRGKTMIGIGQSPGYSNYTWGQVGGVESVTLIQSQMPMHTHLMTHNLSVAPKVSTQAATSNVPGATKVPAALPTIGAGVNTFTVNAYDTNSDATLMPSNAAGTITAGMAGGSQPFDNMQPYLAVNYCIASVGIWPSRP
ncbi:phage tail protein [Chitinophaga sancti]|uniref:Microcystin-dependent protein n=1 Tax=Chitinophaga sancti TaxID=1004 RepID=A0A1K1QMP3_9BACT|nr:tail fiber protein [Chitinophaga sancti]WQD65091.1 tail fiber protein [Chitinophaga sancti]WQG89285.1 tail fiber protein [Chitinophaga sancti]SFW61184.1 Microcystin-dependent protein [Chitinophaga sancti]